MVKDPDLVRVSVVSPSQILTVTALNRDVRDLLEHRYPLLWVRGEISNFTLARSGHAYFSLKDEGAQVRCVMFRHRSQYLDWAPGDGMTVEVHALVTLYEPRGDFQLNVESMRRAGLGALFEAFVRLRDRLQKEGLFDPETKRPLPAFPRRIGVVTSTEAAALRDVLTTLARRNPAIDVVIYPAPVQGEGAANKLAAAIGRAGARRECEVLILARGGGSLEDLWAFNDESLARAIRACPIPVVTGVGHETDYTIADLAADVRAPTPTAAAELASPSRAALVERIGSCVGRMHHRISSGIETRMQLLDHLQRRLVHPGRRLADGREALLRLRMRLQRAVEGQIAEMGWRLRSAARRSFARLPRLAEQRRLARTCLERVLASESMLLARAQTRIAALRANLDHLGPLRVLERGYSIARDEAGNVIHSSRALSVGQALTVTFAEGFAKARVEDRG
jgi:exodeoxyribonuclease VII large subunit